MAELTRRRFLADTASCAGHLSLAMAVLPRAGRIAWTRPRAGRVVAEEKFGRLEELAPGVWAMVSTPLTGDYTTLSNGAIIAGRTGVLVIEGFAQPAGAAWVAKQAKALAGRWPTHALVTHYHGDHANGLAGYAGDDGTPSIRVTTRTAELVGERNRPADEARAKLLAGAVTIAPSTTTTLDLGGRTVTIHPASGHTPSDVWVSLDDPAIVFAGDLLWNGMFPNYVDASPSVLAGAVRGLVGGPGTVYVPGHGPVAKQTDFDRYVAMLQEIEHAAREAHGRGLSAADAAQGYQLPESLGEWILFSDRFIPVAFTAWYRELGQPG